MGERFGYSLVLTDAAQQMVRENVLPELFRIVQEEIEGEWKSTAPKDSESRRPSTTNYMPSTAYNFVFRLSWIRSL